MTYPNELTNPAQANWPVRVNEALKALRGPALYARNDLTSTGLTLGYFGGDLDASTTVADGTVSLTNAATNYVVAHRSTGAVTAATNTTNWDDTTTYGRVGIGVAAGGVVTSWKDARLWTGGIFRASGSAVDADDVTYTPTTLADWDGAADPGDVEQALDQLAERTADLEGAGGGDASAVTYTPTTNADWDGSADPGNVDDALDQLAERVADLEGVTPLTQGTGLDVDAAGFRGIPQNSQSGNYTTVAADAGKHLLHPSGGGAGDTFTIDSNANVAYEVGTAITFVNMASDDVDIAITSDTLTWAEDGTTGTRTLAQYGIATAVKVTSTGWLISGTGLS